MDTKAPDGASEVDAAVLGPLVAQGVPAGKLPGELGNGPPHLLNLQEIELIHVQVIHIHLSGIGAVEDLLRLVLSLEVVVQELSHKLDDRIFDILEALVILRKHGGTVRFFVLSSLPLTLFTAHVRSLKNRRVSDPAP
ncbi:MAG TPA: hypothetical protein PK972_10215 [Deltaproteobacteria bacterium]|nr:hypothetical protein [Deltaproteobacteria bacterium]